MKYIVYLSQRQNRTYPYILKPDLNQAIPLI